MNLKLLPLLLLLALPARAGHHAAGADDIGTLPRPHSEEEAGWIGAGFDVAPDVAEVPSGWDLIQSIPVAPATTADLWLNAYTGALGASESTIQGAGTYYADEATPAAVPTLRTSWKTTLSSGAVLHNEVVTPKPDGPTGTTSAQWAKCHEKAVSELMKLYPPDPPA